MHELELTRTPGDRRLYSLAGVGTVRLKGWMSRSASAEANGRSWELGRRGFWRSTVEATDVSGAAVARFTARRMHRGGTLRWGTHDYALRPASRWRERYALGDGDRELAVFDGKGWGRRPVKVTLEDPAAIDAGLLLFSAFVVHGLAEDAGAGSVAVSGGA